MLPAHFGDVDDVFDDVFLVYVFDKVTIDKSDHNVGKFLDI